MNGGTIVYKTAEEIEYIRNSSLLVGKTLAEVAKNLKPGVTTSSLDALAESLFVIMAQHHPSKVIMDSSIRFVSR